MNEPLTWEALCGEALDLEIRVSVRDGHVFFDQCGSGQHGRFEENLAGCQAAAVWLAALHQAIDVRDHLRRLDPLPRRRMMVRFLWRR